MRLLVLTVLFALLANTGLTVSAEDRALVGQSVPEFQLDNCYGKSIAWKDFEDKRLVAVVFLGTECPLAKLYGPRLNDIQERFSDKGVQVIGINSNSQDSLTEIAAYVHRHHISFPMLKDPGSRVADQFRAERTPEVFLLDSERKIRYHGRIDDQYGVGYSREREASPELVNAIEDLLAGKPIAVPNTEAVGCHIGRLKTLEPHGDVTYTKHIAPIMNAHCVSCHREGEIAPFTLSSYDDLIGWEETILEVLDDKRMPPWSANPAHGSFSNDPSLSPEDRQLLETWVDNGMPEGDAKDLPPTPNWTPGWQIPEPDQIVKMDKVPFDVPAEGIVDYQRFIVDPGWKEDKYITAAEARPDCRTVVHHILVYVIPEGATRQDLRQIVAGYAPGTPPIELTDGIAIRVAANSRLLFEMHYTPNGSAQKDLSYAGFCFTEKENVRRVLTGQLAINTRFKIPPGDANHVVLANYISRQDEQLVSMTPHMHVRGKSFRYEAQFPDGRKQVLLDVPNYDFNWQLKYFLKEPLTLPAGTRILCTAVFDNSEANLTNPDPNKEVRWGDQSFEEMMIGFMDTIPLKNNL
ncbi:Thiol-disulfide oxidoreductase ResA [Roseimaritima multifibrata]|uniref:Thiol-disulfide oxidoreductase ResA n=1 Tax=Roseimaritima multifibrata TaxID=1930274 RepID=A0A517MGS2_9BACT|nr:redoxin domain-containing protein [Roseimaritima multifibrata]QDS94083.1 Thiol-disulfide oxidoreductase ResA [Roseimaritima multifibrata]